MITEFYRGDTKPINLRIRRASDGEPTPITGWVFYVTFKIDPAASDTAAGSITKRIPVVGTNTTGNIKLVLDPSFTIQLVGDTTYHYDIQAVIPAGWTPESTEARVVTLDKDKVKVRQDVTKLYLPPTVSLSPTNLPAAQVGVAYNQTVAASGGTAPYTFAVTSGTLPSGLTLSSAGVLSGTPVANGIANVVIAATDSAGVPNVGSRYYTITVNP